MGMMIAEEMANEKQETAIAERHLEALRIVCQKVVAPLRRVLRIVRRNTETTAAQSTGAITTITTMATMITAIMTGDMIIVALVQTMVTASIKVMAITADPHIVVLVTDQHITILAIAVLAIMDRQIMDRHIKAGRIKDHRTVQTIMVIKVADKVAVAAKLLAFASLSTTVALALPHKVPARSCRFFKLLPNVVSRMQR